MKDRFGQLKGAVGKGQRKIDALSYIGRLGACIGGCVLIFIAWFIFLKSPQISSQQAISVANKLKNKQIKVLQDKVDVILEEVSGKKVDAKQEQLKKDLKDLNTQLAVYSNEFIPADQLDDVLRDMLSRQKGLKLVSVKALRPTQLNTHNAVGNIKQPIVMEKGVQLNFTGTYFATLSYLQDLEALHWRIFWNKFSYQVSEYPMAKVSLQIHTLTTERAAQ